MDKHFAVGLVVDVRDGAKPVGWDEDDTFAEDVPKYRQIDDVAESEEGLPHGSFLIGGWYWNPTDIEVR